MGVDECQYQFICCINSCLKIDRALKCTRLRGYQRGTNPHLTGYRRIFVINGLFFLIRFDEWMAHWGGYFDQRRYKLIRCATSICFLSQIVFI